ncbi:hypothetical protein NDU88_004999 [Pleurodeles waltl]|uniref:Secreted protein n=1 Tax=Pleurodeles waltl TaxID=8319 RepID=A0AAV7RKY7_PLEWA|nr:hypothetical protein NDU88_004999 [Pleurodeles waltl]
MRLPLTWVVALLRATTPQIGDEGVRTLAPGCTPRGRVLDAVLARPETAGKKKKEEKESNNEERRPPSMQCSCRLQLKCNYSIRRQSGGRA